MKSTRSPTLTCLEIRSGHTDEGLASVAKKMLQPAGRQVDGEKGRVDQRVRRASALLPSSRRCESWPRS